MLPDKIPYARILTYDWNANIGHGTSADFFYGHAEAFLHQLSRDRKDSVYSPHLERSPCEVTVYANGFIGQGRIPAHLRRLLLRRLTAHQGICHSFDPHLIKSPSFPCGPFRICVPFLCANHERRYQLQGITASRQRTRFQPRYFSSDPRLHRRGCILGHSVLRYQPGSGHHRSGTGTKCKRGRRR